MHFLGQLNTSSSLVYGGLLSDTGITWKSQLKGWFASSSYLLLSQVPASVWCQELETLLKS